MTSTTSRKREKDDIYQNNKSGPVAVVAVLVVLSMAQPVNGNGNVNVTSCQQMAQSGESKICDLCPVQPKTITQSPNTTATAPNVTTEQREINYRLPSSVVPLHYNVKLQPYMYSGDASNFYFKGEVLVIIKCVEDTDVITMHKKGLTIERNSITFTGSETGCSNPSYKHSEEDTKRDFYTFRLNETMMAGEIYHLRMKYKAPLEKRLDGFYLSSYQQGNKTVYLATTQFSPTDARRAFPCFDEPLFKATFNVTLVRKQDYLTISNMPIIKTSDPWLENGTMFVADTFDKTPNMSTYVLAFIVCNFHHISAKNNNVQFRAFARPDAKESIKTSLDLGIKLLGYMEKYMGTKYPLSKLDFIAIPDFKFGAMENWGAITFREEAILYKPGVTSASDKGRIDVTMAHEISHMWFGNLVSPKWWSDLWLKEGFAHVFEVMFLEALLPQIKKFESFVMPGVQIAMTEDSLVTSHPIVIESNNPYEVFAHFDRMTYEKSASLIWMMHHFLGPDTFKRGIARLLEKRSYQSADRDEVWQAMEEQARHENKSIKVKEIMDTWLFQMNHPILTVTTNSSQPDAIHVRQDRYLANPSVEDPGKYSSDYGYKWTIPITMTTSMEQDFEQDASRVHWIHHNQTEMHINLKSGMLPTDSNPNAWVLVNLNQNGFYRVNYDRRNWNALISQLNRNHTVIPIINRWQIINDVMNFVKSGQLDVGTAFRTIEYLDQERAGLPWATARQEMDYVERMISKTRTYGLFKKFMAEKVREAFKFYGLINTGASPMETSARKTIATIACQYGVKECTNSSKHLYRQLMENPRVNLIDPNSRSVVYCTAIGRGGWKEWEFAWKMSQNTSIIAESNLIRDAMACSTKPWILNHYLSLTLDPRIPMNIDVALGMIRAASRSVLGSLLTWQYFQENYDKLADRFPNPSRILSIIPVLTESFNTPFLLSEVQAMKTRLDDQLGSSRVLVDQSIEVIKNNIQWMERHYPSLADWFDKRYSSQLE